MSEWKRKVLVLRYTLKNEDFLRKRNEIRSIHLDYLRQYSIKNPNQVEFKVAESLDAKSFYWSISTSEDILLKFMKNDPYYEQGLVQQWSIYPWTITERN